ncbi:MAG: serine/threonine-protein kinase [bacterium]
MEQVLKSKYRTGKKLSETPFSVTYQGFFVGTDKKVIIKIYKRGTLNSSLIKSMKQRVKEFSLTNHHGLARLLDGDYGWQGFYYVREYVEGRSIQEILDSGEKIGPEKAVAIADQVLATLESAHAKGIIHGALKPTNIFLDNQGIVKVTDFVVEGEIKNSLPLKSLEVMGNAKYASPEEVAGLGSSSSSDIYALGLILFEMVTGKAAFNDSGLPLNIAKLRLPLILSKEALAPLPNYLRELLAVVLQKDPCFRLEGATEFKLSLEKKGLLPKQESNKELVKLFENTVLQYGGEELSAKEAEAVEEVGQVKLRWGKEKHRGWILALILTVAIALGLLYSFFLGR